MKILKILLFNLLFICVLFILAEFISFGIIATKYNLLSQESDKNIARIFLTNWIYYQDNEYFEDVFTFREPLIGKKNKKPIVLFGCSYTYGSNIENNEDTFGGQLHKYTGRTVYNYGIVSGKPNSALYILSNPKFKKEHPDVDYFIYTYIDDQEQRLFRNYPNICMNRVFTRYTYDKNDNLKFVNLSPLGKILRSTYTSRLFENYYAQYKKKNDNKKLLSLVLENMSKEIKTNYPNAKFIFLYYMDDEENQDKILEEICRKNDIIFIKTLDMPHGREILEKEYAFPNDLHPIKDAWSIIVPEVAKKIKK